MPTKSPGLISSTDAFLMPPTFQSGFSAIVWSVPSRVFTTSVSPLRLAMSPRTCTRWASAADAACDAMIRMLAVSATAAVVFRE
jgi:hypothetical protein